MKAVILSGGKGTRLAPYTMILPKPLVPIGHKPILDIIVRQLCYYGFTDITLTLGYLSELIQAYFSNVNDIHPNIEIKYIKESKPLGTAGSIGLLKEKINTSFLVMNGDILTSLNYMEFYKYHCEKKSIFTIQIMCK
ncbi:nucleoside-diphosphate-sugar pyrophosphorylase [Candidatus Magnetomorum sp. HK-1]|nr:nucleoside-diphosphate-sugar pyrophosphorylase [Candidatus Magnetomorum sp. HK-1]